MVGLLEWTPLEQLFVVEPRIMRTLFELIAIRLERSEEHLEWMGKERQIAIDSAARTRNAASARINASRDG